MLTTNIEKKLRSLCLSTRENIIVFSAYIKVDKFEEYNMLTRDVKNKVLLIRGRKSDFLSKSSDLEVIQYALSYGWSVYINNRIHAKLYLFDNSKALIGSANFTNSGINDGLKGNLELMAEVDLPEADLDKINAIIKNSTNVTQNELNLMITEMKDGETNLKQNVVNDNWSFEKNNDVVYLFPDEMLQEYSLPLSELNRRVLNLSHTYTDYDLKKAFEETNIYNWLLGILESTELKTISFGELSARLHNTLISNDRIYRKDVKKYLANLMSWVAVFDDKIELTSTNFSTIIKLK